MAQGALLGGLEAVPEIGLTAESGVGGRIGLRDIFVGDGGLLRGSGLRLGGGVFVHDRRDRQEMWVKGVKWGEKVSGIGWRRSIGACIDIFQPIVGGGRMPAIGRIVWGGEVLRGEGADG